MRKILFLDFDGVLHADNTPHFSNLKSFESFLMMMPDVEIVISSTWREDYTFDGLKGFFSIAHRDKIIGITPILDCGYDAGGRQREIELFLQQESLQPLDVSWIALDDLKQFFDQDCSSLIWVDPNQGFGEREGQILLRWYESSVQ